jgi:hypothetical protein
MAAGSAPAARSPGSASWACQKAHAHPSTSAGAAWSVKSYAMVSVSLSGEIPLPAIRLATSPAASAGW